MSEQVLVDFRETDFDGLCQVSGRVAVLIAADDRPGAIVRRLDRKMGMLEGADRGHSCAGR